MTSLQALEHAWLANDAARLKNHRINTKNLKKFMARRKWQVCIKDDDFVKNLYHQIVYFLIA